MSTIQADTRGNPESYSGRTERTQIAGRDEEAYNALDPCPSCDSRPHDAPEGVRADGSPHWDFPHCWKCGYRPGVNTAVSQAQMRKQWEDFQQFRQDSNRQDFEHPTLNPPQSSSEVDSLRAQLAEAQKNLAERNTPGEGIGSNTAFGQVSSEPSQEG